MVQFLLLALTSWDKKLEIHIPCPDAKAFRMAIIFLKKSVENFKIEHIGLHMFNFGLGEAPPPTLKKWIT